MAEAVAVCSVYGGPDYRIQLKGQASLLQYGFNSRKIDLGKQVSYIYLSYTSLVSYTYSNYNIAILKKQHVFCLRINY